MNHTQRSSRCWHCVRRRPRNQSTRNLIGTRPATNGDIPWPDALCRTALSASRTTPAASPSCSRSWMPRQTSHLESRALQRERRENVRTNLHGIRTSAFVFNVGCTVVFALFRCDCWDSSFHPVHRILFFGMCLYVSHKDNRPSFMLIPETRCINIYIGSVGMRTVLYYWMTRVSNKFSQKSSKTMLVQKPQHSFWYSHKKSGLPLHHMGEGLH